MLTFDLSLARHSLVALIASIEPSMMAAATGV
jgi:hypothetical protein